MNLSFVENMWAVFMDIYTLHLLAVYVTSGMISFVNYQTPFPLVSHLPCNTALYSPEPTIKKS
jgi:hypothetical protein